MFSICLPSTFQNFRDKWRMINDEINGKTFWKRIKNFERICWIICDNNKWSEDEILKMSIVE